MLLDTLYKKRGTNFDYQLQVESAQRLRNHALEVVRDLEHLEAQREVESRPSEKKRTARRKKAKSGPGNEHSHRGCFVGR